jgi:hypothetical protein
MCWKGILNKKDLIIFRCLTMESSLIIFQCLPRKHVVLTQISNYGWWGKIYSNNYEQLMFFLCLINYLLFHSQTIIEIIIFFICWNCAYVEQVQIRGHVHMMTPLLCCYPRRLQPWKQLHSLIFLEE